MIGFGLLIYQQGGREDMWPIVCSQQTVVERKNVLMDQKGVCRKNGRI